MEGCRYLNRVVSLKHLLKPEGAALNRLLADAARVGIVPMSS
jgi:hypothetical protein